MSLTRRGLVQSGIAAGVLADPALARAAYTMPDGRPWPSVKIGNVKDLEPGKPVPFKYPDAKSPAWLVKLDAPAYEGAGPSGDIVAFSAVCTHMGCIIEFVGDRFVCPCHYSMFDPAKNGQVYQGLASDYLPQILLEIDSAGDIRAVRVSGLVWGRTSDAPIKA
jgi:arsenite oxidase small subunit